MDIGLIVEGHAGLTWERWTRILRTAEDVGLASVFRSDHFFIGRERDSLEAFLSFVVAATETKRIRFGGLVSPVTFRTPADVGRMAAQLDGLSDGRFCLGLGCPVPEIRRDRAEGRLPALLEDRALDALDAAVGLGAAGVDASLLRAQLLDDGGELPGAELGAVEFLIGVKSPPRL